MSLFTLSFFAILSHLTVTTWLSDAVQTQFVTKSNKVCLLFEKNGHDLLAYDGLNLVRLDGNTGAIKNKVVAGAKNNYADTLGLYFNEKEMSIILVDPFFIESVDAASFQSKKRKTPGLLLDLFDLADGLCNNGRSFAAVGSGTFNIANKKSFHVFNSVSLGIEWTFSLPYSDDYVPLISVSKNDQMFAVADGGYCGDYRSNFYSINVDDKKKKELLDNMLKIDKNALSVVSEYKEFSLNDLSIHLSNQKQTIHCYKVGNSKSIAKLIGPFGCVNTLDLSSNATYVATGGDDLQEMRVTNHKTGALFCTILDHFNALTKNYICIYNTKKKDEVFFLRGHQHPVQYVKFSGDEKKLFSYGSGTDANGKSDFIELFIWDIKNGKILKNINHKVPIGSISKPAVDFLSGKVAVHLGNRIVIFKMSIAN